MNLIVLIAKIVLVAFFLLMFLRSNKLVWGVGLLTVTTAILLDTLFSTFSRDDMLAQLGFFFYVIVGGLVAGAALWVWGVLSPRIITRNEAGQTASNAATIKRFEPMEPRPVEPAEVDTAFDRQMLYDQMREQLSPDDLLDVVFDLDWSENDIIAFGQDNDQLIVRIIDRAERRGQTSDLTLAVERVLTPIPRENLPRLEKLNEGSPPTIIRHYLLAYYDQAGLEDLASKSGVDWQEIGGDNKKTQTRNLLLFLRRRGRLPEFINLLKREGAANG
ncbi:MAG: hypothetical protein ACWGPS_11235 [Candidatus Promineifilaceae bacterium]